MKHEIILHYLPYIAMKLKERSLHTSFFSCCLYTKRYCEHYVCSNVLIIINSISTLSHDFLYLLSDIYKYIIYARIIINRLVFRRSFRPDGLHHQHYNWMCTSNTDMTLSYIYIYVCIRICLVTHLFCARSHVSHEFSLWL